jgi:hypothetical protein
VNTFNSLNNILSFERDTITRLYTQPSPKIEDVLELRVMLDEGEDHLLLTDLSENEAIYLKHIIEDYLGIQDMPVRGNIKQDNQHFRVK